MEINVRGEKQEITPAMKTYSEEKLSRLAKYLEKESEVKGFVLFKINGTKHKVEITIPLKNTTIRVEEEGPDYYAAVDTAVDKLERQIRKNKTKLENKRNSVGRDFMMIDIESYEDGEPGKIEKRKTVDAKPMDEDEAILQLELIGHDFYLYKDVDIDNYALIYKRKNGGYGKIEVK